MIGKSGIILLLIIAINCSPYYYVNDESLVEKINSMNTTWKAKISEKFIGIKKYDFKFLLGFKEDNLSEDEKIYKDITPRDDLPENFDLRTQYPECESLREIRDQGSCGSCWAFGAAEVMSDRICIKSQGKYQTRISSVHIVSCCTNCGGGCNAGYPYSAFLFWEKNGNWRNVWRQEYMQTLCIPTLRASSNPWTLRY